MKVTQEKLPASRIGLEIEVTPEMSKQVYDKTLQKFARSANIPGFRKGKVPTKILTSQYGRSLKAAALEELIDSSIKQAIEQEKIDALGNIELRSPFEQLLEQFEPGTVVTISAALDVPPDANLTQYTGLSVQAEEIPYDASRVDEVLEGYRDRLATRVPVEGRPAQEKDLAVVDFNGRLVSEGDEEVAEIPGGSATDFELELSEGRFIPGFIDGIIGMNVGETKEVNATFPDPYMQADLAGKPAVFTVTLKEIKEKELPELDDDFAQEVSEFETLEALRESLDTRFKKEAEDKTRQNKQQAFLDELVKHLEVDLPESLIRREVDYMITQTAMQLEQQGMDIKKMFSAEVINSLRDRTRPEAITRIQRTMALGEIAKKESIKVEESELEAKITEVLADIGDDANIDRKRLREVLDEDLLKEKIFDWLEANNTLELVPEGTLTKETPTEEAVEELEPASSQTIDVEAVATVEAEDAPAEAEVAEESAKATKGKSSRSKKASKTDAEAEVAEEAEASDEGEEAKKKATAKKKTTRKAKADDAEAEDADA
ncbi:MULTISPECIES: trigger factor [unclassified Leptolyngbya]|uniref:trigger factor n=1 Tax=unclassified Leptolyngbya TaxID=2650499 RepID=UPI001689104F|nr:MULTISPECIES: trigger factor [unclassified Leptolyngbya]MBD1914244.1 trigger factor [Leptolyngbya sp. FACHB-8]MBD2157251.1 trigger factor [Leptolyngbya sp. FACHB-16]